MGLDYMRKAPQGRYLGAGAGIVAAFGGVDVAGPVVLPAVGTRLVLAQKAVDWSIALANGAVNPASARLLVWAQWVPSAGANNPAVTSQGLFSLHFSADTASTPKKEGTVSSLPSDVDVVNSCVARLQYLSDAGDPDVQNPMVVSLQGEVSDGADMSNTTIALRYQVLVGTAVAPG